jgi:uncharacterized protein YgiM (DUF1202 family)
MKTGLPIAIALAVFGLSNFDASAGVISSPPVASAPMNIAVADQEMTVSNSYGYANLRQKPSTQSKLLKKLPEGTKVIVLDKAQGGSWLHVKVGDMDGYIQARLLK